MGVDRYNNVEKTSNPPHEPKQVDSARKARSLPIPNIYRPPAARRIKQDVEENIEAKQSSSNTSVSEKQSPRRSKPRRPDIQVYVPRAKRASFSVVATSKDSAASICKSDEKNMILEPPPPPICPETHAQSPCGFSDIDNRIPSSITAPQSSHYLSVNTTSTNITSYSSSSDALRTNNSINTSFECDGGEIFENSIDSVVKTEDVLKLCDDTLQSSEYMLEKKCAQETKHLSDSSDTDDSDEYDNFNSELVTCAYPLDMRPNNLDNTEHTLSNKKLGPFAEWMETYKKSDTSNKAKDEEDSTENKGNFTNKDSNNVPLIDKNLEKIQYNNKLGPFAKWLETYSKSDTNPQTADSKESNPNQEENEVEVVNMGKGENSDLYRKKEPTSDNEFSGLKGESENRKNRRIMKGRPVSDVLVISDSPEKERRSKDELVTDLPKQNSVSVKNSSSSNSENQSSVNRKQKKTPAVAVDLNPDECTWDMMFDDNGDCLNPSLMEELTKAVGTVHIETPKADYSSFEFKAPVFSGNPNDEFSHVVEIYNFPPEFKTEDLITIFNAYKNQGFEIKWVDDTHALGVFSSSLVAADVLAMNHPLVKIRPLSQATAESRVKARRCAEFLQPYRSRPETCVALARRLVTGALGVRLKTAREEREAEKKLLKEAREKRKLAAKQREDAWEGTFNTDS